MNINKDRDMIIIGHPRSGSFWLQSCMPHFNCRELFNTVNFDIVGKNEKQLLISSYKSVLLDEQHEDEEIRKRIELLSTINVPKVTKILTFQFQYAHRTKWNSTIFDWVNSQDADVVWIKRKDKLASFKSLLVADSLGKYIGPIGASECTVDIQRLPWLIDSLSYDKDTYIREQLNKDIHDVWYEELLDDSSFKNTSSMVVQKSSEVTITNWQEVVNSLPSEVKHDIGL
jgi:hypothetical protein